MLDRVEVRLRHEKVPAAGAPGATRVEGTVDHVELELILGGDLAPEEERRLREVAHRCPVHRALTGEVVIVHR
ncbi:MAG: hypothetical protein HY726_08140 [Candidatus Rokubacteria bacterium]|nr:hypothetical protein [Candidatus Rokubacteria bacterium]